MDTSAPTTNHEFTTETETGNHDNNHCNNQATITIEITTSNDYGAICIVARRLQLLLNAKAAELRRFRNSNRPYPLLFGEGR